MDRTARRPTPYPLPEILDARPDSSQPHSGRSRRPWRSVSPLTRLRGEGARPEQSSLCAFKNVTLPGVTKQEGTPGETAPDEARPNESRLNRALLNKTQFRQLPTNQKLQNFRQILLAAIENKDSQLLAQYSQYMGPEDFQAIFKSRGDALPLVCWGVWLSAAMVLFDQPVQQLMAGYEQYREYMAQYGTDYDDQGEHLAQADVRTCCQLISLFRSCRQFNDGLQEIERLRKRLKKQGPETSEYPGCLLLNLKQEEARLYLELDQPQLARLCIQAGESLATQLGKPVGMMSVLWSALLRREASAPELSVEQQQAILEQALKQVSPHIEHYEAARTEAGRILISLKQFEKAYQILQQGGDSNVFRQRLQAMCLIRMGCYEKAYEILGPLIQADPKFNKLWHETAICCQDWGKSLIGKAPSERKPGELLWRALNYSLQSIRCENDYASSWSTLGHILKDMQDVKVNWQGVRQALAGVGLESQTLWKASIDAFHRADSLNPDRLAI